MDTLANIIIQTLSVLDGLSVAYIVGAVTILSILEITRVPHQEIGRGTRVATNILALGIITQFVYRAVDFLTTMNLIKNGEVSLPDLPAAYLITLVITVSSLVAYVLNKKHKIGNAVHVFLQTSIWYTVFIISQIFARNVGLQEMGAGTLTLATVIVVILILMILDTIKRYNHKKSK